MENIHNVQTSDTSLLELTKKERRSLRRESKTGKAECPDSTFPERAMKVTGRVQSAKGETSEW